MDSEGIKQASLRNRVSKSWLKRTTPIIYRTSIESVAGLIAGAAIPRQSQSPRGDLIATKRSNSRKYKKPIKRSLESSRGFRSKMES